MKLIKQFPLASYFVLALLITWTFQLTAIVLASRQGMTLNNENNFLYLLDLLTLRLPFEHALILGLFILGAGPLLSAVFVTLATEGNPGLRDLWAQSIKWRIGIRWYVVAFTLPLVLSAASLGIGLLASGGQLNYRAKVPIALFLPFFLYMVIFTGAVEESGWRGFALPRLQRHYSAYKSSWVLGFLVGLWHVPFIIYYNAGLGIAVVLVSFIILTLGSVGWTIVNTWLYNNTTSVWLMILLHGWGNTVQSYVVLSSNNLTAQAIYGVLPWLIAIVLLRAYGKENLAPHRRPQGYTIHQSSVSTGSMVKQQV